MLHKLIRTHARIRQRTANTHRLCLGVVSVRGIQLDVLEVGVEAMVVLLFFFGVLGDNVSSSSSIHYGYQLRVKTAGMKNVRRESHSHCLILSVDVFSLPSSLSECVR
jgi:hypothetical protein